MLLLFDIKLIIVLPPCSETTLVNSLQELSITTTSTCLIRTYTHVFTLKINNLHFVPIKKASVHNARIVMHSLLKFKVGVLCEVRYDLLSMGDDRCPPLLNVNHPYESRVA